MNTATAALLITAMSGAFASPAHAGATASPCEAPEQFVRASKFALGAEDRTAPLLRPYVIGGIAALSVREAAGQRWLELAVHSTEDARRQLASRAPGDSRTEPVVDTWRDRVWLRCPAVLPARA
jgi:hypothetical protein